MNNLTGLIPAIYAGLQTISRELVGFIPAASRSMTADQAAVNQTIRVPVTPESSNQDIKYGKNALAEGANFGYVDMAITKNRTAAPIVWNGNEEIAAGSQLDQMRASQFAQAMRSLVNEVERDIALEAAIGALQAGNVWGAAGTPPFSAGLDDLAAVKKIQDDLGTPLGDRHLIINTTAGMSLRRLEKLTNANQAGDADMLRRGVLSDLMGYAVRESGGFTQIDPGTATAISVSSAAPEGACSVSVSALSGSLNTGAVIQLAGGYYTLAAPAVSGAAVLNIAPALKKDIPSGTAGTVLGPYLPNAAFSRDFIYLATRTPPMPKDGDSAKDVLNVTDPASGLSFQVALYALPRQIQIEIGLAWGVKAVNKRHGVLLLG